MKEYTVYIVKDGDQFTDELSNFVYNTTEGGAILEIWCKPGTRCIHRDDGPAFTFTYRDEQPFPRQSKFYFLDGKEMLKEAWEVEVEKRNSPPVKELSVEEISKLLGYEVKVVKS